jgi:5-methylcytosine-specific restriction endonuclease McrA
VSKLVYVDWNPATKRSIRIFKNWKAAIAALNAGEVTCIIKLYRADAVGSIRQQLWERSKGFCEWCGSIITQKSAHMHEVKSRGKGGDISLANSVIICYTCHFNSRIEGTHKKRKPQFTRRQG